MSRPERDIFITFRLFIAPIFVLGIACMFMFIYTYMDVIFFKLRSMVLWQRSGRVNQQFITDINLCDILHY